MALKSNFPNKIYRRKELHINAHNNTYIYEFHTIDFQNGILNIIRRRDMEIEQQIWKRVDTKQ